MKKMIAIMAISLLCLVGCSQEETTKTTPEKQENVSATETIQKTIDEMNFGTGVLTFHTDEQEHVFDVELARTPEQHAFGFMFRTTIPENTGMLFIFEDPKEAKFWMKNTYVPLDLFFVNDKGVITKIHEKATPQSVERISSEGEVAVVLETFGGEAERLDIAVGDKVTWKEIENDEQKQSDTDTENKTEEPQDNNESSADPAKQTVTEPDNDTITDDAYTPETNETDVTDDSGTDL